MSTVFLHIAKALRPGLYRLATPVLLDSASNFWEDADVRAGGCDGADVGTPLVYRLHAVIIENSHEWHGFDEPAGPYTVDNAAIGFAPGDLSTDQLLRFLQRARRVSGPGRRRRHAAQITEKGGAVSC